MLRKKSVKEKTYKLYDSEYFDLAAFGLIAVMVLITYSNTFTASFHFDDGPAITDNAIIKRVSFDNIRTIILGARPVVYLSIMLNYQLSGLNVIGWHIFNIGLHVANSFLVYLFILRTLTMPALKAKYAEKAKWMALFGTLLFGVHPIQAEAVTYIVQRSELLAAFFYLGAVLLFISGAQTGKWRYYAAAFLSSVLAMGSKEWAVTLPAVIFLYDYLILSEGNIRTALSRWKAYIVLVLSWGILLRTVSLFSESSSVGFNISTPSSSGTALTAWTYLLTSFNVIWTYARLLFLPINQNIDYDYPIAKTLLEFPTLLSFLGHLAIAGGAYWLFWKKGWVLVPFGVAWFYITLSPVQSFVPLTDVIFEHRLYLPSIGFFLVLVITYQELLAWWERRNPAGQQASAGIPTPSRKRAAKS